MYLCCFFRLKIILVTRRTFKMNAERIEFYNFYMQYHHLGRKHTLSHFQSKGWNRVTIYKYWHMMAEYGDLNDCRKFNHRPAKITGQALAALKRKVDHSDDKNQRALAQEFNVH